MFNAEKVKNECVQWIRDFFENNGKDCKAVVGISGGKDSSIAAALCVEALGKDRVVGVLMPQGEQHDIDKAFQLVNHLGIKHYVVNIKDFGAKENEKTDAISLAIEHASKNGGGKVVIPKGEWLTGQIHLKSNIELHLENGAKVSFSKNHTKDVFLPLSCFFAKQPRLEKGICYIFCPFLSP